MNNPHIIKADVAINGADPIGLFVTGDIAIYSQKQRLILTEFSEAAFVAQTTHSHINPNTHLKFQHSTIEGLPKDD